MSGGFDWSGIDDKYLKPSNSGAGGGFGVSVAPPGDKAPAAAGGFDWSSIDQAYPSMNRQINGSAPTLQSDHFQPMEHSKPNGEQFRSANGAFVPNGLERQVLGEAASDAATLNAAPGARSPWWTAADQAVNTAGLNIPRNAGAAVRSMVRGTKFDDEYNFLKNASEASARENPKAAVGGMVIGGLAQAAAAPELGVAEMGTLGKAGMGALYGGGTSGIAEYADSKDADKALKSTAVGAVVGGAVAPAAERVFTGAVNAAGRAVGVAPKVATTEELHTLGDAAYKKSKELGLTIKGGSVGTFASELRNTLTSGGWNVGLGNQSKLGVVVDELDKLANGNVSLQQLDTVRKMANSARMDIDPTTREFGHLAIEKIDDYLNKLNPGHIATGNSKEAVGVLNEARSLWSSYRKSDLIDSALEKAQQNVSASGGGSLETQIRQQFKQILQNKKLSAGFNAGEKAALARVVSGTGDQAIIRWLGKTAPSSGILGAAVNAAFGSQFGGPIGAAVSAGMAEGAKKVSETITKGNVERLSRSVRARGGAIENIGDADASKIRNWLTSIGIHGDKIAANLTPEELKQYIPETY